jgi:hypothetical protein
VGFSSELKGFGKFPSGKNIGSGTMTQYSHAVIDASYQGTVMTAEEEGERFIWWAHEKSKRAEGGKVKGMIMVSRFTNSQKLSWMNNLIMALDQNMIQQLTSLAQSPMDGNSNITSGKKYAKTKKRL